MIGLLWFDDSPQRSLQEKVKQAARRYAEKFGRPPNVCYVHPSALNGATVVDIGGHRLRVEARRSVLRDHFLIGVCDDSEVQNDGCRIGHRLR
ncbi:MAG: hypothetical protein N2556_04200 [Anaerolineae bacterium]|nr:hypothetical protein [Anaerolineae bacterium]